MTNNRKPVDEVRIGGNQERLFDTIHRDHLRHRLALYHPEWGPEGVDRPPYTPPPNVAAWLQAQADKPKGRDYEALTKAAKRKPVGYWEDAPRGIKFGGQPLPSAGSKPHSKDVDTADGPWPKCVNWSGVAVYVFAGPAKNQGLYHRDDGTTDRAAGDYADRLRNGGVSMPNPEAAQWLEQNCHKDVAAQLRGKGAAGGGRVWEDKYNGWRGVWLNGRSFGKSATCASFEDITASRDLPEDTSAYEVELFGPERDAILAECRKVMGVDIG